VASTGEELERSGVDRKSRHEATCDLVVHASRVQARHGEALWTKPDARQIRNPASPKGLRRDKSEIQGRMPDKSEIRNPKSEITGPECPTNSKSEIQNSWRMPDIPNS